MSISKSVEYLAFELRLAEWRSNLEKRRDLGLASVRPNPDPWQEHVRGHAPVPRESPAVPARYAGKYIAWSPDGTRILASDNDLLEVAAAVEDQGYDSSEIVLSSVPFPDEVVLGGGALR